MPPRPLAAFRADPDGIVFAAPRRFARREVALTFDDGPSPEWTPAVLDVLGAHGARGTFFILGCAIDGGEETLRRMVAEGHELGNHLWSHQDPATLTDDALAHELERTSAALEAVVGARPTLFRPPYAATDRRVAGVARAAGMARTVLRSVDPADWNDPDAGRISRTVLERVRRGSIVCLHDALPPHEPRGTPTRAPTVEALRSLVPELGRRGLRSVTVSELLTWRRR